MHFSNHSNSESSDWVSSSTKRKISPNIDFEYLYNNSKKNNNQLYTKIPPFQPIKNLLQKTKDTEFVDCYKKMKKNQSFTSDDYNGLASEKDISDLEKTADDILDDAESIDNYMQQKNNIEDMVDNIVDSETEVNIRSQISDSDSQKKIKNTISNNMNKYKESNEQNSEKFYESEDEDEYELIPLDANVYKPTAVSLKQQENEKSKKSIFQLKNKKTVHNNNDSIVEKLEHAKIKTIEQEKVGVDDIEKENVGKIQKTKIQESLMIKTNKGKPVNTNIAENSVDGDEDDFESDGLESNDETDNENTSILSEIECGHEFKSNEHSKVISNKSRDDELRLEHVQLNDRKSGCCCESQIINLKSMLSAQAVKFDAMHDILKSLVTSFNEFTTRKSIKNDPNFVMPIVPLNSIDDIEAFDKCLYDQKYMDQVVSSILIFFY